MITDILIVDDDRDLAGIMKDMLEDFYVTGDICQCKNK